MAIAITHATVAATADDGTSRAGPADWNAAFNTSMATQKILGRTTAGAGPFEELEVDVGLALVAASGALSLSDAHRCPTANVAYTNNTSVQPWFATAGAAAVQAGATYLFEGLLLQTNGTSSHTVGLSFAGTATLTSLTYFSMSSAGAANGAVTAQTTEMVTQASNTVVTAAITTAGTQIYVRGIVEVNAGGTFIPQFTFSAAPGAGNVLANSFFSLSPVILPAPPAAGDTLTEPFTTLAAWTGVSYPPPNGYAETASPDGMTLVGGAMVLTSDATFQAYQAAYRELTGMTPSSTRTISVNFSGRSVAPAVLNVYPAHPFDNGATLFAQSNTVDASGTLGGNFTVPAGGSVFIYLGANVESAGSVTFDDLSIT